MDLKTYLSPRGRTNELALAMRVSASLITQWAGGKQIAQERCPDIERATLGAVPCETSRPDVTWHRIKDKAWPWHPAGRPLIDVTAKEGV